MPYSIDSALLWQDPATGHRIARQAHQPMEAPDRTEPRDPQSPTDCARRVYHEVGVGQHLRIAWLNIVYPEMFARRSTCSTMPAAVCLSTSSLTLS